MIAAHIFPIRSRFAAKARCDMAVSKMGNVPRPSTSSRVHSFHRNFRVGVSQEIFFPPCRHRNESPQDLAVAPCHTSDSECTRYGGSTSVYPVLADAIEHKVLPALAPALHPGPSIRKARAGEVFNGAFQVEDARVPPRVPKWPVFGVEVKLWRRTPAANLQVSLPRCGRPARFMRHHSECPIKSCKRRQARPQSSPAP